MADLERRSRKTEKNSSILLIQPFPVGAAYSHGRSHKALSEPSRIFKSSDKIQEIDGIIELFGIESNVLNMGASEKSKCVEDLCVPQGTSEDGPTVRSEPRNDLSLRRTIKFAEFLHMMVFKNMSVNSLTPLIKRWSLIPLFLNMGWT